MERLCVSFVLVLVVACSGEIANPAVSSNEAPSADVAVPPPGVADRGDDPAVVAIDVGDAICSGELVAPDVVLTARHCVAVVAPDTRCPATGAQIIGERAPSSLHVLVGDDLATAEERARGAEVVAPAADVLCGADIALVLLDTPIDDIRPLSVRATGAAMGDHLRTASFAELPGGPLQKLVSDHLLVLGTTAAELEIAEACGRGAGGPAIDETTAEIVGVASRSAGTSCAGQGSFNAYTRTDAFFPLITQALAQSSVMAGLTKGQKKTKTGPVDMGASCTGAGECAAGVCVAEPAQEFCSRSCDPYDRCPAHFRCKKTAQGPSVCGL